MIRRSLKSFAFALSLAATLALGTASLHAEIVSGHISKPFNGQNPCTGENFTGTIDGVILLAGHAFDDGSIRAVGHISGHAQLQGDRGGVYDFMLEGNDQFTLFTPTYDWAFKGRLISRGPDANYLDVTGVLRVYLDGTPAEVISWGPVQCGS